MIDVGGVPRCRICLVSGRLLVVAVRVLDRFAEHVALFHGNVAHVGQVDFGAVVAGQVLRQDVKGRVRVRVRHAHEEGLLVVASQVVQTLDRLGLDLFVVVQLQAAKALTALVDGAEVVARRIEAELALLPVRRPAEVSRVDVGGEALLEAMLLVPGPRSASCR